MLKIFGLVIMSEREYLETWDKGFSWAKRVYKRNDNRDPKTGRFVKRGE